ncbi:unnamed protein product [Symbiodinium sp. CCMP2456]|nr:unnamed protein product [Symbiodinium sp. CCMP2456]
MFPEYLPKFEESDIAAGGIQENRHRDKGRNNVHVRANVLEIVELDTVKEKFQAIFVLEFTYVDPTLHNKWLTLKYRDNDGTVKTTYAQVLGVMRTDSSRLVIRTGRRNPASLEIIQVEAATQMNIADVLALSLPAELRQDDGWSEHFALDWSFMNAVEEAKIMMQSRHIEYFSARGAHVKYKAKFNGLFSERLELNAMPFDRQLLRIQVVAEVPIYRLRFVPVYWTAGLLKTVKQRQFEQIPREWRVDGGWLPRLEVLREEGASSRSRFDIHVYLERNPTFYLYNLCLLLSLFTLLTAIGFSVDVGSVSDRLSVHLTLLLTTVAYKYVVTTWLPVKSYLTRLDKFTLRCFYFQIAAMVLCALQQPLQDWGWATEEGILSFVICVYTLLLAFLLALGLTVFLGEGGYCKRFYHWCFYTDWHGVYISNAPWPQWTEIYVGADYGEPVDFYDPSAEQLSRPVWGEGAGLCGHRSWNTSLPSDTDSD